MRRCASILSRPGRESSSLVPGARPWKSPEGPAIRPSCSACSLASGGNRVDVETTVDWKSPNTLLKASFPLAASNAKATYDLGLGTIQRGNNTEKAYEVPAQKWADITDASGAFGAAVVNDSKYGWDKPADNVLRLTLLHTPLPRASPYQSSNDLGHHVFTYAIVGHHGDWRDGQVPSRAAELNQRLVAFQTAGHASPYAGRRSLSLASTSDATGQIAIRALKKAEDSSEFVVRLQEQYGRPGKTILKLAGTVVSVREINAAEEAVRDLSPTDGSVVLDFLPYQPRTIAVVMTPRTGLPDSAAAPLILPFNLDGVSTDKNPADGNFDDKGHTISGDLLPRELRLDGVPFTFGSSAPGALNVLVPKGQTLTLPPGAHDRVYLRGRRRRRQRADDGDGGRPGPGRDGARMGGRHRAVGQPAQRARRASRALRACRTEWHAVDRRDSRGHAHSVESADVQGRSRRHRSNSPRLRDARRNRLDWDASPRA